MTPEEIRATGRLGVEVYAGTVAHIEKAHKRVASRVFRMVPAGGEPVQAVHDVVARLAYRTVRGVGAAVGNAVSEILPAAGVGSPERPAGSSGRSNHALAVLNAAIGDRLAEEDNPMAIHMAIRLAGRDLSPRPDVLQAAFPAARSRVAVFVHGLGETDDSWRLNSGPDGTSYGSRLAADLGYTCVYVRYNTGRHISHNGQDLARLLGDLVTAWPLGIEQIVLVGHSMGGLVIRSACHYGQTTGVAWVPAVHHVVYLGCPHLGAPMARWAQFPGLALAKTKESLPFAPLLTTRSAAIDDLRFGYLLDEDWADCDTHMCRKDHGHNLPLLATANHYTVSATVTRSPDHPVGQLVGDLLVQPACAHGRRRRGHHIPFAIGDSQDFGGLVHFQLLNNSVIYQEMRTWLNRRPLRPNETDLPSDADRERAGWCEAAGQHGSPDSSVGG
jgi:pimeloyl-ACP methyl ester carboxylesterase